VIDISIKRKFSKLKLIKSYKPFEENIAIDPLFPGSKYICLKLGVPYPCHYVLFLFFAKHIRVTMYTYKYDGKCIDLRVKKKNK
jgi:hypothetical protein